MNRWTGLLFTVASVSACTGSNETAETIAPEPEFGPLFVLPWADYLAARVDPAVTFRLSPSGCAYYEFADGGRRPLAFASGTTYDLEAGTVTPPQGQPGQSGAKYELGGGGMNQDELETPEVHPRWLAAIEVCTRDGISFAAGGAFALAEFLDADP